MFETIQAVIRDMGPIGGFAAVREYADERAWMVALDEETILAVDLDERRGLLVVSADIGTPPVANADRIARLALAYAMNWHANGGAYVGGEADGGDLRLFTTLAIDGLQPGELAARLHGFSVTVAGWRRLVATPADDNQSFLEQMASDMVFRA